MQTDLGKIDLSIDFLSSTKYKQSCFEISKFLNSPSKLNIDEGSINNPKILEKIPKSLGKIPKSWVLPSVSPDSSPSDINSSSEQIFRTLTSISVTEKKIIWINFLEQYLGQYLGRYLEQVFWQDFGKVFGQVFGRCLGTFFDHVLDTFLDIFGAIFENFWLNSISLFYIFRHFFWTILGSLFWDNFTNYFFGLFWAYFYLFRLQMADST